jgi:hypothetical protein
MVKAKPMATPSSAWRELHRLSGEAHDVAQRLEGPDRRVIQGLLLALRDLLRADDPAALLYEPILSRPPDIMRLRIALHAALLGDLTAERGAKKRIRLTVAERWLVTPEAVRKAVEHCEKAFPGALRLFAHDVIRDELLGYFEPDNATAGVSLIDHFLNLKLNLPGSNQVLAARLPFSWN